MSDLLTALSRLTFWEIVLVLFVANTAMQASEALARWLLNATVGPWLDVQGERIAAWVRRRREARP